MIRNYRLMKCMGIAPRTVIHVGSHYGQDNNQYELLNVESIYWCEADSICASELRSRYPNSRVIEGVFWSAVGKKMDFWIMSNRAHNSLYQPKLSDEGIRRVKVSTTTLDFEFQDLELTPPIMLILDVQGAELEVLRGSSKLLSTVNFLVCEITDKSSISNFSVTRNDVEKLLKPLDYSRSIRRWSFSGEYFDQLYVRRSKIKILRILVVDLIYKLFLLSRFLLRKFKSRYLRAH